MRARMLVDAKIVNADPEHPLAAYEAGEEIEGPAAALQVALGHAQALPEAAGASEVAEHSYDAPEQPQEAPGATKALAQEAPAAAESTGVKKGRR